MLWHRRVDRLRPAQPCRLPAVLPEPDPNELVLVMHKGFGSPRIEEMTRAEADRKAGLTKRPKRK